MLMTALDSLVKNSSKRCAEGSLSRSRRVSYRPLASGLRGAKIGRVKPANEGDEHNSTRRRLFILDSNQLNGGSVF